MSGRLDTIAALNTDTRNLTPKKLSAQIPITAQLQRIGIYVKCDKTMDPARKNWNTRQRELRTFLANSGSYHQAIDLFLQQHAEVHSGIMSTVGSLSFEDEVIIDYWRKRTIAGLLLMPPTRHCFIHLNEALKIKKKVMKLREVFANI